YKLLDSSSTDAQNSYRYERIENEKLYVYNDNKETLYLDFESTTINTADIGYVSKISDNVAIPAGLFNKVKHVDWLSAQWDGAPSNKYAPNVGLITSAGMMGGKQLVYAKIGDKIYQ